MKFAFKSGYVFLVLSEGNKHPSLLGTAEGSRRYNFSTRKTCFRQDILSTLKMSKHKKFILKMFKLRISELKMSELKMSKLKMSMLKMSKLKPNSKCQNSRCPNLKCPSSKCPY